MFRPAREPQSKRHVRSSFYVIGEGILAESRDGGPVEPLAASTVADLRKFRFSRLGPAPGRPSSSTGTPAPSWPRR